MPAGGEVTTTRVETRELLVDRAEMVEAIEGAQNRGESAIEIERRHVRAHEFEAFPDLGRLLLELLSADREHVRGKIEADDASACLSRGARSTDRSRNPSSSTGPAGASATIRCQKACSARSAYDAS